MAKTERRALRPVRRARWGEANPDVPDWQYHMIFSVFPKLSRMTKTCVERRGQRPGYGGVYQSAGALKGRNIRSIVPPLQGSRVSFDIRSLPKALPWADMRLPLRGWQIAQHKNAPATDRTQDPRRTEPKMSAGSSPRRATDRTQLILNPPNPQSSRRTEPTAFVRGGRAYPRMGQGPSCACSEPV